MWPTSWKQVLLTILVVRAASGTTFCHLPIKDSVVNLNNCGFKSIRHGDMEDLLNPVVIRLEHNDLEYIHPYAFYNKTTLRDVLLANNPNIKIPQNGSFLCSNTIETLDLSDNRLDVLKPSSFECLPALRTLILRGNRVCQEFEKSTIALEVKYKVMCDDPVVYPSRKPVSFVPTTTANADNQASLTNKEDSTTPSSNNTHLPDQNILTESTSPSFVSTRDDATAGLSGTSPTPLDTSPAPVATSPVPIVISPAGEPEEKLPTETTVPLIKQPWFIAFITCDIVIFAIVLYLCFYNREKLMLYLSVNYRHFIQCVRNYHTRPSNTETTVLKNVTYENDFPQPNVLSPLNPRVTISDVTEEYSPLAEKEDTICGIHRGSRYVGNLMSVKSLP